MKTTVVFLFIEIVVKTPLLRAIKAFLKQLANFEIGSSRLLKLEILGEFRITKPKFQY